MNGRQIEKLLGPDKAAATLRGMLGDTREEIVATWKARGAVPFENDYFREDPDAVFARLKKLGLAASLVDVAGVVHWVADVPEEKPARTLF